MSVSTSLLTVASLEMMCNASIVSLSVWFWWFFVLAPINISLCLCHPKSLSPALSLSLYPSSHPHPVPPSLCVSIAVCLANSPVHTESLPPTSNRLFGQARIHTENVGKGMHSCSLHTAHVNPFLCIEAENSVIISL